MKRLLFLMVIGMVFAFGAVTHAGEATGDLNVTATALEVCSVTTSPIPFGSYTEDEVRVNGSVIVTCTKVPDLYIGD